MGGELGEGGGGGGAGEGVAGNRGQRRWRPGEDYLSLCRNCLEH